MATPAVTAALLQSLMRQVANEIPGAPPALRVGEVLAGRVATGEGGARFLMIDGVRIPATLPADVAVGVPMRFRVSEVAADRLVLQVVHTAAGVDGPGSASGTSSPSLVGAASSGLLADVVAAGAPWAALALPGGQARVWLDPESVGRDVGRSSSDAGRTMVVRYDSSQLGRIDVVLRLGAEQLEANVIGQAGEPVERMRSASGALRTALVAATGRTVVLSTGGRTSEAVNVSA